MARMIEQYLDKERQLLDILYDRWTPGEEVMNVNQKTIAPALGISAVGNAMRQFESLGIVSKRLEFGKSGTPSFGRHYHYTLLMTRQQAIETLDDSINERLAESNKRWKEGLTRGGNSRKGKPLGPRKTAESMSPSVDAQVNYRIDSMAGKEVALATNDKEEVRAIAGEDAPSSVAFRLREAGARKPDESAALVEAARQYQGRSGALASKVTELEALAKDLGVTIDTSLLAKSVSFDADPVLEIVVQVLPYIEQVERNVKTLTDRLFREAEVGKEVDALRRENRALREQNQRLIARTANTPVAHA